MGGSTLGAHVIQAISKQYLRVPLEIIKDYNLPSYINEHTLVILSSYSGTTEETLAAAKAAEAKHAKIAVITSGGDLQELALKNNYPHYFINPTHNPSNQPRMAIGYAIVGQVGLLKSFGLIDCQSFNIEAITTFLKQKSQDYAPENTDNLAISLAKQVENKIIFLVSAEHLTGSTHVFNNQLNENAKHLTVELQLPELNHHYMEGLSHPDFAKQNGHFLFVNSQLYSDKLQLRVKLTQDVVTKNGYSSTIIDMTHTDPIVQAFELIQLGAYVNFYLAMLHDINPAPIPWVDYFKAQLKANS
jgi:glucose/mannose-6-phosphate isomerase